MNRINREVECLYCGENFNLKNDNWIGFDFDPIGTCPNCHQLVFVDNGSVEYKYKTMMGPEDHNTTGI